MSFIVFSDDWGVHPSSCQHLFRIISRSHPTLWVNTVGLRPPRLTLEDLGKVARKVSTMVRTGIGAGRGKPGPRPGDAPVDAGPAVCAPFMAPFQRPAWLAAWNARSVIRAVTRRMRALGLAEVAAVTTVPNVHGVVGRLGAAKVIYYCVDDFSEWPGMNRPMILDMEKKLLRSVAGVICTSQALHDRFKDDFRSMLLTHGVDVELFAGGRGDAAARHPVLRSIPEPRVGYYGLFDGRTDDGLLAALARALPEVSFVITGPTEGDRGSLRGLRNVHFTGPVPYGELPQVVRGWKACILPYRLNDLTVKINPLKLKEYLASGKPVVAAPLPEAERMAPHVRIAGSVEEWVAALRAALSGEWIPDSKAILESLRPHAWERKAQEFIDFCEAAG